MPTIVHGLDEGSQQELHVMCQATYLDGECYAFAIALQQGLGWPMIGLMQGEVIRHAVVRSPDGRLLDARGFVSENELGEPFGLMPPYGLSELVDIPLRDGEPAHARASSICMARKMAEAIWPKLPWRDSLAKRVTTFANDLETLCRKHNLWIRSPVLTQAPVIGIGDGDECGYKLEPTIGGMTYTIDRYF